MDCIQCNFKFISKLLADELNASLSPHYTKVKLPLYLSTMLWWCIGVVEIKVHILTLMPQGGEWPASCSSCFIPGCTCLIGVGLKANLDMIGGGNPTPTRNWNPIHPATLLIILSHFITLLYTLPSEYLVFQLKFLTNYLYQKLFFPISCFPCKPSTNLIP